MEIRIIDKKTGKEPTERVIYNIAKKGGLMTMDIDQFAVLEDGHIILTDDCGNVTYCDMDRFRAEIVMEPMIYPQVDGITPSVVNTRKPHWEEIPENIGASMAWAVNEKGEGVAFKNVPVNKVVKILAILGGEEESE